RWFGTNTDITELREIEESLRESEARYKTMGEAVPFGIWLSNAQGRMEYVSNSFLDLLGMTLEEIQTTDWTSRLVADQAREMMTNWQHCLETGADWDQEFHLVDAQGSHRTVWSRGKPVRNEQGQIINWVGINLDVTERKRREQNSNFLASLGDQLLSPGDPDTVIHLVCEQLGQYLHTDFCSLGEEGWPSNATEIHSDYRCGHSPFQARHSFDLFPKTLLDILQAGQKLVVEDAASHPLTRQHYEALFASNKIGALIILPRLVGGQWIGSFTIATQQPRQWLPDELELLESVANLAWLAVDQARTQQSLRTAEERFHIALQNTPIVVFTQDAELRYTWIHNPRPGFDIEQVLGKRDDELLDAEAASILTAPKHSVLESGQSLRSEVTYRIDVQPVTYDLTLEPLKDSSGKIIGLTGAAMDLTDLRRLEADQIEHAAQVEVQRRLIQHREMERMDIARDLHDSVLQELTAVSFALADAMSLDEKQERIEKLQWVQQNLHKQSSEIRTFCNELRPPALAPFGLEKAIRSHLDEYQHRHANLALTLNLQADRQILPEETRMALFRIYQEVLNNVTKHAQASHVWITWTLDAEEACLEIEDNGIGFTVPRDWVAQARSGHLGLLGIRERVQSIGGQIEFDARPGKGTRVRVLVPRQA
ncbi:MAG TPA: PAS domain-containing protein, partial [Clostridia bacterium]|nr:PAS domain-containing protein [Clostridia bacterium]